MLSMISYLNLSSGVYIPLYWLFVIKISNIYCFFKPNWWMLKIWSPNHHWTVPSMKWISLYHLYAAYMRWISGGFFVKKHLTQFSTFLQPFYNLPGWPGVLPQGQADDMCITLQRFAVFAWSQAHVICSCKFHGCPPHRLLALMRKTAGSIGLRLTSPKFAFSHI